MSTIPNPFRGRGLPHADTAPMPSRDAEGVARLLAYCPAHHPTPLINATGVAAAAGVAQVWIKDERSRMGLGSFKALGAAFAIAAHADQHRGDGEWASALRGQTFVTASAGNHGLSVAAGARLFGAQAAIFLAQTVPEAFAQRLRDKGAQVHRAGATYEDSMRAAEQAAQEHGWTLLSDSSWPGYTAWPTRVMQGYLQLMTEAHEQLQGQAPTHIVVQAGVGGLAAAVAVYARQAWGDTPQIIVVEPEAAPALQASIAAGHLVDTEGAASCMGRLDCKTPSMIALKGLARDADAFVTISDTHAQAGVEQLQALGLATSPSGGAGLAALLCGALKLGPEAKVLTFVSEEAVRD